MCYCMHYIFNNNFFFLLLQILTGHKNEVWFVQFSNNGEYLASSSNDCTAIIWKVSCCCNLMKYFFQLYKIHRILIASLEMPICFSSQYVREKSVSKLTSIYINCNLGSFHGKPSLNIIQIEWKRIYLFIILFKWLEICVIHLLSLMGQCFGAQE